MPFDEHNPEDNGGDHGGDHEHIGKWAGMIANLVASTAEFDGVCPFCGPVSAANLIFAKALVKVRLSSSDEEISEFLTAFVNQAMEVSEAIILEEDE